MNTAAAPETPNLVSRTHIRKLTTTCNFSSRTLDILFWPPLGSAIVHT